MVAHTTPSKPFAEIDRLVTANFNLARFWAGKFTPFYGYNDALSVAMRGLLEAAEKYDPENYNRLPFGTYASIRIKWRFACTGRAQLSAKRGRQFAHVPIDAPIFHDGNRTLADELTDGAPGPRDELVSDELRQEVMAMLEPLPERTRCILEMRYGLNGRPAVTLEVCAKKFRLTRERVRQIEAGALRKFWRDKHRKKLVPVTRAA